MTAMAPATVIDLTREDSDIEEYNTTGVLAAFGPRKEKTLSGPRKQYQPNDMRTVHAPAFEQDNLAIPLLREKKRGAELDLDFDLVDSPETPTAQTSHKQSEPRERGRLQQRERRYSFQAFQERRVSDHSIPNASVNGAGANSPHQQTVGNGSVQRGSITAGIQLPSRRTGNGNRISIGQSNPISSTPVLSGSGLQTVRDLGRWGVKRPCTDLIAAASTTVPFKRARLHFTPQAQNNGANARRAVLVDVSENSAAERITYSDEPEIPTATPAIRSQHYSELLPTAAVTANVASTTLPQRKGLSGEPNRMGLPFVAEEDALLKTLKEKNNLGWDDMVPYFNGRTRGSLQVRYSTKLKDPRQLPPSDPASLVPQDSASDGIVPGRTKRNRKSKIADGFVTWESIRGPTKDVQETYSEDTIEDFHHEEGTPKPLSHQDLAHPSSVSRILRQRELGSTSRRAWSSNSSRTIPEELKNHVFTGYRLRRQYHGTSGDVVALSWSSSASHFAAGSIAISDNRSMQYNMQRNLLVGDTARGDLQELVEHCIPRPEIEDSSNVNGLHAMRRSQDPRLFMTVTATEFASAHDSVNNSATEKLYSTGTDRMLRLYTMDSTHSHAECCYAIEHKASVDLLAVKAGHGIVATGCHAFQDSISLYRCKKRDYQLRYTFSPGRQSVPIFPSALAWGIAPAHRNLLLAGFSGDEEAKQTAGETCLWDGQTGQRIELRTITRNVFDIAWNAVPSSASISFAVAANSTVVKVARATRSVVQCFAPKQNEAHSVITFECPAVDINDLVFCPHDDNLIAAGATNGKVYVWDIRSAKKNQQPLHILCHGESENVLAHDRDHELADTGVRFLSWGATSSRLYSGSSDGIVKIWNPYRGNPHVDDLESPMQRRAAVMSGSFSPDYEKLLIGTENGQIIQFDLGSKWACRVQPFKLRPTPQKSQPEVEAVVEPFAAARLMIESRQIEIRPMGAMPLRQAVQGPNYSGPFLAPSQNATTEAEQAYQQASCAQNEAMSNGMRDGEDSEDEEVVKSNSNVREAQHRLDDLQERFNHFSLAEPKAREFQRSLQRAEADRKALEERISHPIEPCELDCGALPKEGDEPEDSGRSEVRIPDVMRSISQNFISGKSDELEPDRTCFSCFPTNPSREKRSVCASCTFKKARLTAVCTRCSGPTRVETDPDKETVCERCSFSCFRCSGSLKISEPLTSMYCPSCNLEWEVGTLGYELSEKSLIRSKAWIGDKQDSRCERDDNDDEIGMEEMQHYASLWEDRENEAY